MKIFLLATLFLSTQSFAQNMSYLDSQFECFSAETATQYARDFRIDIGSFGGKELCDSKVDFKKLMNDLYIIQHGQFTTGSNIFIRGFIDANNYYGWMKSQTRGMNRKNDIPQAVAYNSMGFFTMQDGWARSSTLGRVGTVIHEARHTAFYRHIPCNQGAYQDVSMDACDKNYEYGGSHAIEMEYYARVSVLGTNFHPVYQKMARHMAIGRSNIFFNQPVIQKKETLLGLSADRSHALLLADQNTWYKKEVPQVEGVLKRTSFGAVLFDRVHAYTIDPYQNSGFTDLVTDAYSYFKMLLDKNLDLKDYEEFDLGTKRYVVKVTNANVLTPYSFANGGWGKDISLNFSPVNSSTFISTKIENGYYLIDANQNIYDYQPETGSIAIIPNEKWNPNYKKVVRLNNQALVLKQDGSVVEITHGFEQLWESAPQETLNDLITIPIYNGFNIIKE